METFSALLALYEGNPLVTGGIPSQRPVWQTFVVFFNLCLNKWLSKQSRCQWSETPSRSSWRSSHCILQGFKDALCLPLTENCALCQFVITGGTGGCHHHYIDVIITTMASQITSLTIVYSTLYSGADQRKHQSSASLAFVWGIHRDWWIPRTKSQLRGKYFHLMTSSWWKPLVSPLMTNFTLMA